MPHRRKSARFWLTSGLVILIAFAVISSPLDGLAAGSSVGSRTLARGSAVVPRCDVDDINMIPNVPTTSVVSVTVSSIDAGCATGTLSVTVRAGASFSTGSATVPSGGGSVVVTLASSVAMTQTMTIDAAISGP